MNDVLITLGTIFLSILGLFLGIHLSRKLGYGKGATIIKIIVIILLLLFVIWRETN